MNMPELIALIGTLLAGFAWISGKLERINTSIAQTVTHDQCSQKREKCPCVKEIHDIKQQIK